jgi:hypothetical protein
MTSFKETIGIIGVNPYVTPPEPVLDELFAQAGRRTSPIPVKGKLRGHSYIQTLVRYQGAWRLYLNGPMLKSTGLTVGDTAELTVEFDPKPREVAMVAEFEKALKGSAKATAAYEKFPPSHRKEILRYLGNLKSAETLERNIRKVIAELEGKTKGGHVIFRGRR